MRGLVLREGQLALQTDLPTPEPDEQQALLKIRKAGICSTDLELIAGYMNFEGVLGHEFVAEVTAGPDDLIGCRVVGEINVADGNCEFCQQGIPSQCSNRTTVGIDGHDGAFADYLALTTDNLHFVPDSIDDEAAVFVEPLAAALQILEAVHISPRTRIAVVGIGRLGTLVAQVLKLTGANLVGVVRREEQAKRLASWQIPAFHGDELAMNSFDIVVDCTGNPDGFALGLDLVRPLGALVLKSTFHDLTPANLTRVVVDEIRVIGSRCGPFEAAIRVLAQQQVDVHSLIVARYSLDDGLEAIKTVAQPGVLKVLLEF